MRRVFYSFHYERDIWRVSQVRNHGKTRGMEPSRLIDHAAWEAIERRGDDAVRNWIEKELIGAGVSVILIGAKTYTRRWVLYEIRRSHELGKGIVGVQIHRLRNQDGTTDAQGLNPLDYVECDETIGTFKFKSKLSTKFKTYDYVLHDGYENLATWVEEAARIAGR